MKLTGEEHIHGSACGNAAWGMRADEWVFWFAADFNMGPSEFLLYQVQITSDDSGWDGRYRILA